MDLNSVLGKESQLLVVVAMAFVGIMIEEEIHEMMELVVLMRRAAAAVLKILEKIARNV